MIAKEHDIVVLVHGLPEHGLEAGDVGTVVDVRGDRIAHAVELGSGRS